MLIHILQKRRGREPGLIARSMRHDLEICKKFKVQSPELYGTFPLSTAGLGPGSVLKITSGCAYGTIWDPKDQG